MSDESWEKTTIQEWAVLHEDGETEFTGIFANEIIPEQDALMFFKSGELVAHFRKWDSFRVRVL